MYSATTTTFFLRSALSTAAGKPLRVAVAALGCRAGLAGRGVGLDDGVVGTRGSGVVDASPEPPRRFNIANPSAPTTPSTAKIWTGRETVTGVLSAFGGRVLRNDEGAVSRALAQRYALRITCSCCC
jgi:hypothetical protein